jgi:hypothetical protein
MPAAFLSFTPPSFSTIYERLNVYKRVNGTDTLVYNVRDIGKEGYWYYFVVYPDAEEGSTYVVAFQTSAGAISSKAETVLYFPPALEQERKYHNQMRIGIEHLRRARIVMERMGQKVIALKRKTSGTRCKCYEPVKEESADPRCQLCYGVGWLEGYNVLQNVLIDFQPSGQDAVLEPYGISDQQRPRVWALPYPLFQNGDVIVRLNEPASPYLHKRYEVQNWTRIIYDGVGAFGVTQEFSLEHLEPSWHPVYEKELT